MGTVALVNRVGKSAMRPTTPFFPGTGECWWSIFWANPQQAAAHPGAEKLPAVFAPSPFLLEQRQR